MSANDQLFDGTLRHQIFLIRYGGARARELLDVLAEAERDLEKRISEKIAKLPAAAGDPLQQNLIKRLGAIATNKGAAVLEAPVTGGLALAKEGGITILVGGEKRSLRPNCRCCR